MFGEEEKLLRKDSICFGFPMSLNPNRMFF